MFLELGEAHVVINPLRPARAMLAHGGDAHGDIARGDDAPRRTFRALCDIGHGVSLQVSISLSQPLHAGALNLTE